MEYENLSKLTLVEVLSKVEDLKTVAPARQVRAMMAVPVKCTMVLADTLGSTTQEIRSFNNSTESLTRQMLCLNRWLTAATIVAAIATFVGAVATAILAYKAIV
jgi:hypothetical protein